MQPWHQTVASNKHLVGIATFTLSRRPHAKVPTTTGACRCTTHSLETSAPAKQSCGQTWATVRGDSDHMIRAHSTIQCTMHQLFLLSTAVHKAASRFTLLLCRLPQPPPACLSSRRLMGPLWRHSTAGEELQPQLPTGALNPGACTAPPCCGQDTHYTLLCWPQLLQPPCCLDWPAADLHGCCCCAAA